MQRRLSLTLAGSAAFVVIAAGAAAAANLGILATASSSADSVGVIDASNVAELVTPTTAAPLDPVIVYVDEYITVPGEESPPSDSQGQAGERESTEAVGTSGDGPSPATVAPRPTAVTPPPPTTVHREDDDGDDHELEPIEVEDDD